MDVIVGWVEVLVALVNVAEIAIPDETVEVVVLVGTAKETVLGDTAEEAVLDTAVEEAVLYDSSDVVDGADEEMAGGHHVMGFKAPSTALTSNIALV